MYRGITARTAMFPIHFADILLLPSRRLPSPHLENTMASDQTPNGHPWRGGTHRGRPVSFGWSNMNMGNRQLRSIRNQSQQPPTPGLWQTSSVTVEHGNKVSSGWSNMNMENQSWRSIMNKSPQPPTPRLWQSSSVTVEHGNKVTSGRSNLNMGNRSSRSIRNYSPQPLIPVLWQSSSETLRHGNKVSSGKSLMYKKDGSWGSSTVYTRNNSQQCPRLGQTSSNMVNGSSNMGGHRSHFEECIFDIYRNENKGMQLKKPLFEQNREKIMELEQKSLVVQPMHLRPGMILLKNHISHEDQVSIIKCCRESGIREGGFYRPGYSSGSKLRLQMMCMGQDWDPETRKYYIKRHIDGATPPPIPDKFKKLVDGAIRAAQEFLWQKYLKNELPSMSPETCIVNFYSNSGKLGLHQDRDESRDSIRKGVPIVSFSVGDSAEFLYGVKRDVDMADKIVLESGDVLIFGGKSRSIFHGVSSIFPNTAPKRLIEESKLKPGRLNLTFRQL